MEAWILILVAALAFLLGCLYSCWRLRPGRSFKANLKTVIGGGGGPIEPP
jgi:hypothetical protein